MDLILPTNQNTSVPVTLDTKVLVVIGANGAGKSSFGRNLHQRYAGQSVWISGMHSLFLSSEESKAPADGNELARLQSMIARTTFHAAYVRIRKIDPAFANGRIRSCRPV